MHLWLTKISALFLLFSINVNAMDPPTLGQQNVPEELFLRIGNFNPEMLMKLACVCNAWREIISKEDFWKKVYARRRGTDAKLIDAKSYRENCQTCLFSYHILDTYEKWEFKQNAIRVIRKMHPSSRDIGFEDVLSLFENALTKKPHVFCTYCDNFEGTGITLRPAECLFTFLEKTIGVDTLVIFPVPNGGCSLSKMLGEKNLHEAYPNVIWLAAANCNLEFTAGGEAALADIAVPCDNEVTVSIEFGNFVAYLRSLRPGLSATTIRLLIRETANNGLINYEAAKRAIIKHEL